jgi:hypothetical protein
MTAELFQIQTIERVGARLEATVQHGERTHHVFFESEDISLFPAREAIVAISLYPSMKTGCDLEVNGDLNGKVMEAIPSIQDLYHCWDPAFQHISLRKVRAVPGQQGNTRQVGLFFSGGIDSWYSLLKSQSEITDLIFVWGLDIPLSNQALYEKAVASIRRVAASFNKHLIIIRTNLLAFTDEYLPWNKWYGTALAAMAHLMSSEMRKVYIAGGEWYNHLMLSGSHVLVDPRWSTENLEIIYDGLEVGRLGKTAVVARNELALETVRVCWINPDGDYNCGRCEKCLRTMVNLQIVGALEHCTTFAVPLDLKRLSKLTFFDQGDLIYLMENTRAAQQQPHNRRLFRVLRRVLNRFYFYEFLRKVRLNYKWLMPDLRWLKRRLRKARLM